MKTHAAIGKTILGSLLVFVLMMAPGRGWGQILTFEFSALAGDEATASSNSNNANLTSSTISRGVGLTANANGGRFNATSWALTSIANAVSGNDYMEFTITPNSGYQFTVSSIVVQWQRSSTGNTAIALRSSVDAYATDLDAVKSVVDGTTTQTFTWTFTQTNSSSAVTYRFYSYAEALAGSGGPGDGTGNDIVVNGTVTSTGGSSPTVTTQAVSSIGTITATGNGNITATGGVAPTARGFCWDLATNPDPDISDSKVEETGTFSTGAFTGSITGLTIGTQYKVRAFATNTVGTGYGSVVTFYTFANEPTNHATSFTATTNSQTAITTDWLDNDGTQGATGFLVMANTSGTFTDPVDGIAQTDDNNLSDGSGNVNVAHGVQTYTWNNGLSAGTPYYFKIFPFSGSGAAINYKTDGTVPETNATTTSANDVNSYVDAPGTQANPVTISSLADTDGESVEVFKFKINDVGTDGLITKVTQVTIKPGTNNVADWAATIQGVKLSTDGGSTFVTTGTATIATSSIVFPISVGNLNIANGGNATVSLFLYLKSSGLTDNQVLEFNIPTTSHGFTADATGSTFLTTFAGATTSNQMSVNVVSTKFNFSTQPSNTSVNTNFSAGVEAVDANGNRDLDATYSVTLGASVGTITSVTGNPHVLVAGVFAWSDLQSSTAGTGVTLSATGSLTTATSNAFRILSAEPTTQASAILFTNVGMTSMTVSWTNGNGANRIVVGKAAATPTTPTDGASYTANSVFGTGGTIAANEYVVYNGTGSSVDVTGLTGSTSYTFKVFEYNGSGGTENYITTSNAATQATTGLTYYSNGSGDPATLTNWKTNRDGTGTSPANFTTGETFVIENGDNMTTTTTWSISGTNSKLQIESGGILTANNAITLASATTFRIEGGGNYIHNNTLAFATSIFQGIESFSANSTVEFRDWNTTGPSVTAWGNVKFNATGAVAGSIQLAGNMTTINGNLEVVATGSPTVREVRLAASTAPTITCSGNFTQTAGIVNLASTSGVTIFNVVGNFAVNGGTFTSTSTGSKVVFNGSTTQNFTNTGTISTVNFEVGNTSTLNMGTQVMTGGSFTVPSGATLLTANLSGLNGSITVTGTKTFDAGANYTYNGTADQVTGTFLPATLTGTLKISNTSGKVTQSQTTAIGAGGTCTIDAGATLATGAYNFTSNTGTVTVNGTFQIDEGGWGGNTGTYIYNATTGSLAFNNSSGTYGVASDVTYWPSSNGPVNVNVKGAGGITMNVARTVTGTFQTSAVVTNASNLTFNGIARLNTGGSFASSPTYGSASTLIYNTGGTYGRYNEWNATTGPGYPANVQLSNNTTLNYPNGSNAAKSISGSLTIDAGSALYMDYGTPGMNNPLTVAGNVTLNGALSLGDAVGGDLKVGGNWTNNTGSTFTTNSREVEFNGGSAQSILGTAATTFGYFKINNSAGVNLSGNIAVDNTLTLSSGAFSIGANTLTLNGDVAATSGTITGGATSNITVGGSGTNLTFPAVSGGLNNLTISRTNGITLGTTSALTVAGTLTNSIGIAALKIKSDATGTGSLITPSAPAATVERYLTNYVSVSDKIYHFISSPVSAQAIQTEFVADPPAAGVDFYAFDEVQYLWINTKTTGGIWNTGFESNFVPGKGYMVAYPSELIKNFTGNLNAGTFTTGSGGVPALTYTSGKGNGWNLLGNPYPSAIDWTLVTRSTGVDDALYYYDASAQNYRYYIKLSGDPSASVGSGSRYIPAMQGFMVHTTTSGTSITMEDVDRVHDGQTIYYKSSETLPGSLSLTVSAGGFEDAMFVHFNAEATTQFDGKYDAYKLSSYNEQVPQLYTVSSDNQNLAINGLPGLSESLQIPVYFKAGVAGQQSLTADVSQVPSTVYLTDLKTSFTQNLRQNPDYTFTAADGDAPNRFLLHFAGVGIGEPAATRPVTVYMSGNVLHVGSAGAALTGEVFVYNMMGQLVAGQKLDGSTTTAITLNVRTGYYLVKVVTTNDTFTSKIFIQ